MLFDSYGTARGQQEDCKIIAIGVMIKDERRTINDFFIINRSSLIVNRYQRKLRSVMAWRSQRKGGRSSGALARTGQMLMPPRRVYTQATMSLSGEKRSWRRW